MTGNGHPDTAHRHRLVVLRRESGREAREISDNKKELTMAKLPKLFYLIFVLFVVTGCGSNLYVNKSYQNKSELPFKLAIIPITSDIESFADSVFTIIFRDSTNEQQLIESSTIREKLLNDEALAQSLNRVILKDYSKAELSKGPNLKDVLDAQEIAMIEEQLYSADLMLVPVVFSLNSSLGLTIGNSTFRLYDLHSGELIFENSRNPNVNLSGEIGKKHMAISLIGWTYDDYEQHFLSKVNR